MAILLIKSGRPRPDAGPWTPTHLPRTLARLSSAALIGSARELAAVLVDAVEDSASAGVLRPVDLDTAAAWREGLASAVVEDAPIAWAVHVGGQPCALMQPRLGNTLNGRHRAAVARLTVHRGTRGHGPGCQLLALAGQAAAGSGTTGHPDRQRSPSALPEGRLDSSGRHPGLRCSSHLLYRTTPDLNPSWRAATRIGPSMLAIPIARQVVVRAPTGCGPGASAFLRQRRPSSGKPPRSRQGESFRDGSVLAGTGHPSGCPRPGLAWYTALAVALAGHGPAFGAYQVRPAGGLAAFAGFSRS